MGVDAVPDGNLLCLSGWLWVNGPEPDSGVMSVRPVGGVAGDRALELWAALESALEQAAGSLVIADLAQVTAFDLRTVNALTSVAQAAGRWHRDFCAVAPPVSPLAQYLRCWIYEQVIDVYGSTIEALAHFDAPPGPREESFLAG
ncbi:MAG TPA: hypothetical protein VFE65_31605 [Pseudonocardia sp.]|nr:hypothetical protein [Pseudonocardia sp.]